MWRENENCQSGLTLPVGSIVHYVSQEILAIIQTNVPLVRANLLGHSQSRPTIISVITLLSLPFRSIFRPSSPPSIFFSPKKMINITRITRPLLPSIVPIQHRVLLKENRDVRRVRINIYYAALVRLLVTITFTITFDRIKQNVIVRLIIVTQCPSFD